ncbi:hypothetical protein P8452_54400 [Trifolium repens]|nr:hypothetical protein P8452_54400 [Trifolium repens]
MRMWIVFARGVGLVSLLGDKSDGDRKIEDLKLLYRAYVTNALASGHMQDNKYGFTKREKKKSFFNSLKILYVKKMSQRQKGTQNSLGKPPHWPCLATMFKMINKLMVRDSAQIKLLPTIYEKWLNSKAYQSDSFQILEIDMMSSDSYLMLF